MNLLARRLFLFFLLFLEKIKDIVEVFPEQYADALCPLGGDTEIIAVVVMIESFQADVAAGSELVLYIEVAHQGYVAAACVADVGVVYVANVAVKDEPIVKQHAAERQLYFGVRQIALVRLIELCTYLYFLAKRTQYIR